MKRKTVISANAFITFMILSVSCPSPKRSPGVTNHSATGPVLSQSLQRGQQALAIKASQSIFWVLWDTPSLLQQLSVAIIAWQWPQAIWRWWAWPCANQTSVTRIGGRPGFVHGCRVSVLPKTVEKERARMSGEQRRTKLGSRWNRWWKHGSRTKKRIF